MDWILFTYGALIFGALFIGGLIVAKIDDLLAAVAALNDTASQVSAKIDTLIENSVPPDQLTALEGGITAAQTTLTEALNK